MSVVETIRVGVPAFIVPAVVFGGNWAWRSEKEYNQTAASDFLLALLIFDGAVIATSETFQEFVRDPELKTIVIGWHITMAAISIALWWSILRWGEPRLARYYQNDRRGTFPWLTFWTCWGFVLLLVMARVLFFVHRING